MKLSWIIVGSCGIVTTILTIVSLVTTSWAERRSSSVGLWQYCSRSRCTDLTDVLEYVWATRIFLIFSVISSTSACILSFMAAFSKNNHVNAGAVVSFVATALFILISMTVFTNYYHPKDIWGYSYILGWVSFAISLFLCVGSAVVAQKEKNSQKGFESLLQ